MIDFMLSRFREHGGNEALVAHGQSYTYGWLLERIEHWRTRFESHSVPPGSVVALEADFTPDGVALFLAAVERRLIVVPLTSTSKEERDRFAEIAQVESSISLREHDLGAFVPRDRKASHPLYAHLRASAHPGLVLFSSGSSGPNKAAVHDFVPLLNKFRTPRPALRTISFLLYDHIGGINTMLHTLSNAGCLISVRSRDPEEVLKTIEAHRAELLPTSPTFLNLILLSGAAERYPLESLKVATYGTEPMPESTLRRFRETYPHVSLKQTYGLSELGIMRAQSRSSDSLWMRVGGEGYETRIVDGILQIKAASAMLGYLNAPSPFTDDGWFNTGDVVEVDGEWIRILGRKAELINVGGEKVAPTEVEDVLLQMPNVADAVVSGAPNAIVGQMVVARVTVRTPEDPSSFKQRMREFCRSRLAPFKIPAKVELTTGDLHSERFKKLRRV